MYTDRNYVPDEVYEKVTASLILASLVCVEIDNAVAGASFAAEIIDGHTPHHGVCHLGGVLLCEYYGGLSAIATPVGALTIRHPRLTEGRHGGPFLHTDHTLNETLGLKPLLYDGYDTDGRPKGIYIDNVGVAGPVWDITRVGKAEIEESPVSHDGGTIVVEACHVGCRRTKNIFSDELSRQLFSEIIAKWGLEWSLEGNSRSIF